MGWPINNCSKRTSKGGFGNGYRGDDWELKRYQALRRDDFTCQFCGKTGVFLEVHHVFLYRVCRSNNLENLVSVCRLCHRKVEKLCLLKSPFELNGICRRHEVCRYANRHRQDEIAEEKNNKKMRNLRKRGYRRKILGEILLK